MFVLHNPAAKMRIMNREHETVLQFFLLCTVESHLAVENVCYPLQSAAYISSTMRVSAKTYVHINEDGSRSPLPSPPLSPLAASKETATKQWN